MSVRQYLCIKEQPASFVSTRVHNQVNIGLPAKVCISAYSFIYSSSNILYVYYYSFSWCLWLCVHGYVHAGRHICSDVCVHMWNPEENLRNGFSGVIQLFFLIDRVSHWSGFDKIQWDDWTQTLRDSPISAS